jgi:hypothetical protein
LPGVTGPSTAHNRAGVGRKYDASEGYGLLSPDYQHIAAPKLVELLRTIQN